MLSQTQNSPSPVTESAGEEVIPTNEVPSVLLLRTKFLLRTHGISDDESTALAIVDSRLANVEDTSEPGADTIS